MHHIRIKLATLRDLTNEFCPIKYYLKVTNVITYSLAPIVEGMTRKHKLGEGVVNRCEVSDQ